MGGLKLDIKSIIVIAAIIIVFLIIIAAILRDEDEHQPRIFESPQELESPQERAGRQGEYAATNIIKSVLRSGDYLLNNVEISYDGKPAELDNVIVNRYGVFIIEVKNYTGELSGKEDDYEWKKYKNDGYGNIFVKEVRNPIKQVKRQVYILAKYLDCFGVWVEGYAFFVQGNSPVKSESVLESVKDIDRAIHSFNRNRLNKQTVESIQELLSCNGTTHFCM